MDKNLLSRVLEESKEAFIKYGVRNITMDDISKNLGISKKTLYTVVKDKNELIEKTSFSISDSILATIRELLKKKLDPISELLEIENIVCNTIMSFNPSVIHQFQKYYPAIHTKMRKRQKDAIINTIIDNINRGIKDGFYRDDIDVNFMAHLDYSTHFNLTNSEFFPEEEFDIREIKHQYIIYHIRGISSSKGISLIEKKLKN